MHNYQVTAQYFLPRVFSGNTHEILSIF